MDRRKKIIIILIAIVLVIAIILLLIYFFGKKPIDTVVPPVDETENIVPTDGLISQLPAPSEKRAQDEKDYPLGLKSLASSYAERFASYSTDANFKNLQDLKIISTVKMQSYINELISTSVLGSEGYESQEARALNNQLIFLDQTQALVLVSLQLTKFVGEESLSTTSYTKLELNLVKIDDEWNVDEVTWK